MTTPKPFIGYLNGHKISMDLRRNKLGLQEFNSEEYKAEHRLDITSMLEFSNQLHIISNTNNTSPVNHREMHILLDNFIAQFEYLNDSSEREGLAQLMLETLKKTDDENNIKKLPANNALFLIFKFKKAIQTAVNSMKADIHHSVLFLGDKQKQDVHKTKNLELLKSLERNLNLVFNNAFVMYGMGVKSFLTRFDKHPLWKSILAEQVPARVHSSN